MQKDIFKKIITILYLTIFLFGLFMPFNIIFAEDPTETNPLIISTAKNILLPSEPTEITAKLYSVGGETVSFSAFYTNGSDLTEFPDFQTLSQRTCTPLGNTHSNIVSCSVTFSSAREKTYIIKASIIRNGQTFSSPNITILIAKPITDNQQSSADTDTTYTPLAPLPGLPAVPYETDTECPFGNYLNIIIKLIIGIAAVLAMVMIVMGGIEYMTSDLVSSKEAGKDTIRNAILGLLIALGAYLILNTINPQLLSVCLDKLPKAVITILPYDANINSYTTKTSGNCRVLTSGDCSVENLKSVFGDKANSASMICSVESGGIADKKSGSDYCSIGKTTFSFGLFQINLLVHGDKIPSSVGNCKDLFTTSKGEEIGYGKKGYVVRDEKGNYSYDCKLKSDRGDDYNKCSAYLKTASGNLFVASKLFKARVFEDWRPSDQKVCPAAFQ